MKLKLLTLILALAAPMICNAELPSIQLSSLQGEKVTTATLNAPGKPVLVSFFATWCKPCRRELTAIHDLYPDWQDETGMELIAVSIDIAQDQAKVRSLVEYEGWDYTVWLDPNSEFLKAVGGQSVPYTVLFDAQGNIVYSHMGYQDGQEASLYEEIKKISSK